MATDAEIANDLDAQAAVVSKKRLPEAAQSIRRGATAIRRQMQEINELQIRLTEVEKVTGTDKTPYELMQEIERLKAVIGEQDAALEASDEKYETYFYGTD